MGKTNVLKDVQDMVVVENLGDGNYVYAAKPSLIAQKQFYDLSIANPDDENIRAFNKCWKFEEKRGLERNWGIEGSNTYLALRFDKLALRPNNLWIPGLLEAKVLDNKGKLERGSTRDYGIIIYNDDEPNKQIAEVLVPQVEELGLELPLIVPFRALDYVVDQSKISGIKLSLINSRGIIQGKKAQNKINSLDCKRTYPILHIRYKKNSGVRRLLHDKFGDWDCYDTDFEISGDTGRIDWVCFVENLHEF